MFRLCVITVLLFFFFLKIKFIERMFFLLISLKFFLFIYLFMAVLGLRCCTRAFSSCSEQGLLFVAVRGFLTAVASLAVEHGLKAHGLQ